MGPWYHEEHLEPDVVGDDNHVFGRAGGPMCAPENPEGDVYGAGNKDI